MLISENEIAFAQPALNLIKQRWPEVWARLSGVKSSEDIELAAVEPHPAFSLNGIQLASSYDPEAEASLQGEAIKGHSGEVWVYGVGMGYLVRQLLEQASELSRLHVYIMNQELFLGLLHWVDQSDWLINEKVELHIPTDDTGLVFPYAVTTPCLWLADVEAYPLRDRIQSDLNSGFARQEWQRREHELREQLDGNRVNIENDSDVSELIDELNAKNERFIIAAAGPSLKTAIGRIAEEVKAGALLIAVDAALRPLLNSGLVPDVVVTADAARNGVLPNFTGDLSSLENSHLVYFPVVHPDVVASWKYRRYTAYPEKDELYDEVSLKYPKGRLFLNGSVVHPAVDFAVKAGAKTVLLAGADFAYPHNKTHVDGVPHGKSFEVNSDEVAGLTVKDGNGDQIPSKINMISYLRFLEMYIKRHPNTHFINLSRDGAYIAGTDYED